jgi:hypothetical protein
VSSPEEPPTEPTATNGDAANEHGAPRPTGRQGAAEADAGRPGGGQPGTSGPADGTGDQPGQPGQTAQPGPSAQSEQPTAGGRPEPSDQSGEVQSGGEQQGAGQSGTSGQPGAGQPDSGGADGDEPDIPQLSPIPPGGTTAPADTDRVFGRTGQPLTGVPTPAGQGAGWQRSTAPADAAAQPSEADLKKIRSRGRWALAFGIIGLLALLFFPLGLFLGVAAIVFGIMGRRLARRMSVVSPGAVPGIVLGIVSTMASAVIGVTLATFWTEISTYTTCVEGANTHSAQNKCMDEFKQKMEKRGVLSEAQ